MQNAAGIRASSSVLPSKLRCLDLVLGYQGGDDGILVFQHAPVGQALNDGVGGGGFPAQLLLAQTDQFLALDRFVLPENEAEAVFAVVYFGYFHGMDLLYSNGLEFLDLV